MRFGTYSGNPAKAVGMLEKGGSKPPLIAIFLYALLSEEKARESLARIAGRDPEVSEDG